MAPEVSVLIPSYNHAHYLGHAIRSVLKQSFSDWEVIIIDDGSTDNTKQVTDNFSDPRIRYIYQENQGLSAARNTGIRMATTEIIALLDADDIWHENYLAEMMPRILTHSEVVAVYCGFHYIDKDGEEVGVPNIKVVPPNEFDKQFSNHGNWLATTGVVFRKDIAEKVGCFDESLRAVEDADMWSKISDHGMFVGVAMPLIGYRRHDSNMSDDPQRMVTSGYKIIERYNGPPQGDVATWTGKKKRTYTGYFRNAAIRYLAFGDIQMSAYMFLRMNEISPEASTEIGTWRSLARANLPIEIRNSPDVFDWESAEADIQKLLIELERIKPDSKILNSRYSKISGSAYLALSEESFRAKRYELAYRWMLKASTNNFSLLLSRPYWGTLVRGIEGVL